MKRALPLFATALVASIVGCGAEPTNEGQAAGQRQISAKIKAGEEPQPDGGAGPTGTDVVTFTAAQTGTATETTIGTITATATATHTGTAVATSTDTTTLTESATQTATTTQTVTVAATVTTTATRTATGTVTSTRTQTATASTSSSSTQTATITQTVTQLQTSTVIVTDTITDTATRTVTSTETRTVTSSDTSTATRTRTNVLSATHTYVLTGTLTAKNTATASNVEWLKALGRTATTTTTQFLLGTASKTVTATVTNPYAGTATKTVTARATGTGTVSGTATVTATATRTLASTYQGAGSKTITETVTTTGTGTQSWTYHPTETLTQTQTGIATQTLTRTDTLTDTVTLTVTPTLTLTGTRTDTLTSTVTHTLTSSSVVTNTSTETVTSTVTNTDTVTGTAPATDTATDTLTITVTSTSTTTATSTSTHPETVTATDTTTGTATGTVTVTSTVTSTVTTTATLTDCVPGYVGPGVIDAPVQLGQSQQVSDLQGIWCITGNLEVMSTSMVDLAGLESLVVVGGSIEIANNPSLTSLSGLGNLRSAQWLSIHDNAALTSLAGLGSLRTLAGPASISNNLALPACWAWEIARQTNQTVGGGWGNLGSGSCGSLPEGFVCAPGAVGPGVLDMDMDLSWMPDLRQIGGVTCITGNLRLRDSARTDVAGLETLVAVGGSIEIANNPSLANLSGLGNLRSAQWLSIHDNAALTSLAGLASLRTLAGPASISNNPALPACWAWEIARQTNQTVGGGWGNFGSGSCGTLPEGFVCAPGAVGPGVLDMDMDLSWMPDLRQIGGVTCITGNLRLRDSARTDVAGLETLVAVGGSIEIANNPSLANLSGLGNLRSAQWLSIHDNAALTSLAGLASLRTLAGPASISNNPALPACWAWEIARQTNQTVGGGWGNFGSGSCGTLPEGFVCAPGAVGPGVLDMDMDLSWMPDLRQIGGVTCITGNLRLRDSARTDVAGLETLVAVGGSIEIANNPSLANLSGLGNLRSAQWLSIHDNAALTSLAGLASLRTLAGPASISNNPALPACWAWEIARQTNQTVGGGWGNFGSGSCGSLPEGFVCAPGAVGPGVLDMDMDLSWMPDLRQIGGVTCITGNLRLRDSARTDVAGLETLVAVGGSIEIANNPSLANLSGLGNLRSAQWLSIHDNAALTSLAGLASLRTLAGPASISNNPALPACWAWEIARQTNQTVGGGWGNFGSGSCGTLPEGFVCAPGAVGLGVLDTNMDLSWMPDLRQIGGVTCITGNLLLRDSGRTDVAGLETLVAVGGSIEIANNPSLASLSGLGNLRSAQWLSIHDNAALTSLAGLGSLGTLAGSPWIANNAALPACWAERVAQQVGQTCSCSENNGSEACP